MERCKPATLYSAALRSSRAKLFAASRLRASRSASRKLHRARVRDSVGSPQMPQTAPDQSA
eukprot:3000204-Lingulodinium_polyedra.AAC.1